MEEMVNKIQGRTGTDQRHYVVAIGASAGGLEAIHEFFDNMPLNTNLSFVIIQHLSPDHKSLLVELLSKHTYMKVFEAENSMIVQKECVYVIPNNKLITIRNGKLFLEEKTQIPNTAIDTFLYSLAKDKREKAVAVILSGTGTDGTKGIEAVKRAGGMVIVQDPVTARFDGMLNSAITSGNADFILPPEMMADEIWSFINEAPVHVQQKGMIDDRLLEEVFSLIYKEKGYDFHYYKTPTIIRRIGKRMGQRGVRQLHEYVEYLRNDQEEVRRLGKDFLIGVTRFFRDEEAFNCLYTDVLPSLINNRKDGDSLKVWVCACSTGEEAYSLAILIDKYLMQYNRRIDVKIFATDIDENSIEFASRNVYPFTLGADIKEDTLSTWFVKERHGYSVIPRIRRQIVFAKHDIIRDPPFIKNDLVSCRNMLIYMSSVLQQKVLSALIFSLNTGGYMFLGSSETASSARDTIDEINSKWKIYRRTGKNAAAGSHDLYRPVSGIQAQASSLLHLPLKADHRSGGLEDEFRRTMTEDLGYACFYIDDNYEIKETVGNFSRFLSLPEKKLNLNILKMVRPELSVVLNAAVRKCWKENRKVAFKNVRIREAEGELLINIVVKPFNPADRRPHTIVILGENGYSNSRPADETPVRSSDGADERLLELEEELHETRSGLRQAVENLETLNEELQSSNEELLSANEELQSGNEELQSLNEELHTLNTENQLRIKELTELNDDLNNYFRSIDIGQIFLDRGLRIRRFNQAAIRLINLIDSDIGRPVAHISVNMRYDNLLNDIHTVIDTNTTIEKEICLDNDNLCLVKILPYLRHDKSPDGVIITFVDISAISRLNNIIGGVFNSSLSAIMVFRSVRAADGAIEDFVMLTGNAEAERLLIGPGQSLVGMRLSQIEFLSHKGRFEEYRKVVLGGSVMHTEIPYGGKNERYYEAVAVKMTDGFVITLTDISEKKTAEQKLRNNYNELIAAREKLKYLNSVLEEKVEERTRELTQSEERFRLVANATNDVIWDWSLINNALWWSNSFYLLFAYKRGPDNETGDFWLSKIHPDDRERVEESIYSVINSGGEQWSQEYRFMKEDGTFAVIYDRGYVMHDEYGTPYRMLGSMLDMTAQREAELKEEYALEEIRKSGERFKFLANAMPQKVWTALPDGRVNYFNAVWLNYVGRKFEDLEGWKWQAVVHPDDLEENERLWTAAVKAGTDFEMERRLLGADGEYRWHLSRAIPQKDEAGNIHMWVGTSTDIHEQRTVSDALKASEDYFRQLADQSPFMIWKVDSEARCNYVNKQWVQFTGLSFDDSLDMGWQRAFHPDDAEREYCKFMDVFDQRKSYYSKFRVRGVNGEYHWVLAQSNPISGTGFEGYIGSLTDITEQELAQQATKLLLHKKDEFMSIASHELKTPITSMKASLQIAERLVAKDAGSKQISGFIQKANKQVNKLTALVEDLLDVTKIQAGKLQFHTSTFVIGEVIQDCLDQMNDNSVRHKIIIEGDEHIIVEADRHRLEQVIINFLSNAIKYSPDADQVILKIEGGPDHVRVSVTDFGIGIPSDKINYIFDRFFRVQESSQKFSGLGLGLFISSEIIKRHGGQVGVHTQEGKGSTFWFSIPLKSNQ